MTDTLREYLVALGFKVDDETYKKYNAALAVSAKNAAALGSATVASATAAALAIESVAEKYTELFYVAQRSNTTVSALKTQEFAMRQIGLSAQQSRGSVEGLAAAMRLNPGIGGMLRAQGVDTSQPTDKVLRDYTRKLKERYGEAGYFIAARFAQQAGIAEEVLLHIWKNGEKLDQQQADAAKRRKAAGLDTEEFTQQTVNFTNSWNRLLDNLELAKDRIVKDLIGPVGKAVDVVDQAVQMFNSADVATNGWIGSIAGVTAGLGGLAGALAIIGKSLGAIGLTTAGAAAAGGGGMIGSILGWGARLAGVPAAVGAAIYYGGGFNGATAGKEKDEPLSKEYRAKNGDRRQATIDYFIKQGWSREAATGIAANIAAESNFRHDAVGDGGQAYGLGQWHPDRQRAFQKWAGKDIRQSTHDEQMAFYNYELTEGPDAGARRAGQKLRNVRDAYEAGAIVSGLFERPKDVMGEAHKRGSVAQNWFDGARIEPNGGGNNGVVINQKTDIHVDGAQDPQSTAREVAGLQARTNGDMVRNFKGAVQ